MCFHARARAAAKQLYVGHLGAVLRLNVASRRGDSATAVRRLALQRRLIRLRWPWTRPATKAAHEAPALSWPSVSERRRNSPTQLCERRAWLLRLKRPSAELRAWSRGAVSWRGERTGANGNGVAMSLRAHAKISSRYYSKD